MTKVCYAFSVPMIKPTKAHFPENIHFGKRKVFTVLCYVHVLYNKILL